jgi:hypothetical protein
VRLSGGLVLGLVALAALLAAAAPAADSGSVSIEEVVDAAASYANREVTLVGTVDPGPIAYHGESLYTLREAGRAISVLGQAPAPAAGAKLAVTGQVAVRPPDEEFTFPPILLETQRTTLP